jgi:hypothetical protein
VASISHDVCFDSGHAKGVLRLKQSTQAFPSVLGVVRPFDKMDLDAGGCTDDFRQAEIVAFHPGLGVGDSGVVLSLIPLDVDSGHFAIVVGAMVSLQKNKGRDDGRYQQGTINVFP